MGPMSSDHGQKCIDNPHVIHEVFQDLLASKWEFQLRVEGANTLPYASQLLELDPLWHRMTVKLIRPLPYELPAKARFRMIFTSGDGRYEAPTALMGRTDYLQYDFEFPQEFNIADRRIHPRFPFRPRENVLVLAQLEHRLGLMGPLLNLSLSGLGMRLDRILNLDQGIRIPAKSVTFCHDQTIPWIRIHNLPTLPVLELQGRVARTEENTAGSLLGIAFEDVDPRVQELLGCCLEQRAQHRAAHLNGTGPVSIGTPVSRHPSSVPELPSHSDPSLKQSLQTIDPLRRLRRRCQDLLLVMTATPIRERLFEQIWNQGFMRAEAVPDVDSALQRAASGCPLLLIDAQQLGGVDMEPLAMTRNLSKKLAPLGPVPAVMLWERMDESLLWARMERIRHLPYEADEMEWWSGVLDDLLNISETELQFCATATTTPLVACPSTENSGWKNWLARHLKEN